MRPEHQRPDRGCAQRHDQHATRRHILGDADFRVDRRPSGRSSAIPGLVNAREKILRPAPKEILHRAVILSKLHRAEHLSDETDEDLARLAAGGDRVAFAALAERHYDRIFAMAWRWAGDRTAAEDIAQDAMIRIARSMSGFRGECAFRTWVWRIVFTVAQDARRAARKTVAFAPADIEALADGADMNTPEQAAMGADLWRAVRCLPEQQRDAILLVYGEDFSHAEAADVMGCSEKTVSWHVHEGRKRLREKLEAAD